MMNPPANPITNKVALVTGAGKGIGKAIALMLAREGAQLMLNARTLADLDALRQEIHDTLSPAVPVAIFPGSVADAVLVEEMIHATMERFGRIDILINNAGVAPHFVLLQELTLAELNDTIDINLKGPLFTMKFALPHMVHQGEGGVVININSVAGKTAYPYSSAYCAAKFGLTGLTECVAGEQRQNNIKVVGIYPGEVLTPLWDGIEPGVEQNPAHMLEAEDIAQAVRYVLHQPPHAFIKDITLVPTIPPTH